MLVLSRRKDEAVLIPDLGVTIKVLGIRGNQVRLGFEAPEFVEILRQELREAKAAPAESGRSVEVAMTV